VALLVDKDGHVIAANVNTNAGSQMRHAEVNLLLAMASRGINRIPAGATIYTSLKPCRMCASLILSVQEDCSPLRVVTLADDEGRHGKHRMLLALEIVK
jgi:tRNA(Arg) A34 adenosine deaminase TadA